MGFDAVPQPGLYVRQLVKHASVLRRDARAALSVGDHERAAALLDEAEMLAADVRALVDAMEERQSGELALLAAEHYADTGRQRTRVWGPRSKKLGAMLGASLAMSIALVEC